MNKNEICYGDEVSFKHLWGPHVYPLKYPVPTLVLQMAVAIGVNHGLLLLCQRFGQPRFVSNIMTSLVLSPSILNVIHHKLTRLIFPLKSFTILKTVANLGLIYATFIQALQAYPTPITHCRIKLLYLSFLVFIFPFTIGCALYLPYKKEEKPTSNHIFGVKNIYWGVTIAATGFSTLAPILAKLKLLCTRLGQGTLVVGLLNNFFTLSVINITLAISTSSSNHNDINIIATFSSLLLMIFYLVFCCMVIGPGISRAAAKVPEGKNCSNVMVHMILFLVLACGLLTDYLGSHFVFGVYVLGRFIPPGILAKTLIEKMEDCVDGVLMPLYFMVIGVKLDVINFILNYYEYAWVVVLAVATKVVCTFVIGIFCKVPPVDGFSLGILLSSKGLLPLALLNIGHERKILTTYSFTMLFFVLLLSTILVGPIMSISYKLIISKTSQPYDQRSLKGSDFTEKFRLITCIHSTRNIASIINLLEISNITIQNPASVHITHLIELLGHASAMLIEHETSENSFLSNIRSKLFCDRVKVQSDQIIQEINDFKDQHAYATTSSFKVYTVVSPISTMHEDICSLAEDKQASMIILPFHKQQGVDEKLEDTNMEFGVVNQNVLSVAPCSVALFVDRGLRMLPISGSFSDDGESCEHIDIAMVYIGGSDDREALTYAWRMAGHPSVSLTVIRFLEGEHAVMDTELPVDYLNFGSGEVEGLTTSAQKARDLEIDNEFLMDFHDNTMYDSSICYIEKVVNSGEEVIDSLKEMHYNVNLYVVGRGQTLLTTSLVDEWSDCKELGPLGDILVASDFTSTTSVLVIQQYVREFNKKNVSSEEDQKMTITSS